ncbi:hypothetical protein EN868_32620, partial [Mesorhizobium sp. M2D.F.Ca.ET.225.01.1.1]|uniref:hypothetical protein n=1 Tax=Mesorhizobium sp. M2D.F.Ca.ET.225.01.1.1 TaxID=2563942 RepID=UPI00109278D9
FFAGAGSVDSALLPAGAADAPQGAIVEVAPLPRHVPDDFIDASLLSFATDKVTHLLQRSVCVAYHADHFDL